MATAYSRRWVHRITRRRNARRMTSMPPTREPSTYCWTIRISKCLTVCGSRHAAADVCQSGWKSAVTTLYQQTLWIADMVRGGVNFFDQKQMPDRCTAIVTNPPYKFATEYVLHALRLLPTDGLLCLFLKTTFAEGKERYQRIFGVTPPALVLQCSERVLCARNADFDGMIAGGGSAVSYAWWVWRKGYKGDTTLDWINHPTAQQAVQLELFM